MEVIKSNFNQLSSEVMEHIDASDFIAIDSEFTGLHNGENVTIYDLPEDYYYKLRTGQMDFLIVQIGLCMFKYNAKTKSFTHRAYNFYVYPQSVKYSTSFNFLCEASSLEFLMSNGFDFNKLIEKGIPFLSHTQEEEIRTDIDFRYKNKKTCIQIPDNLVAVVDDACKEIEDYLTSENTGEFIISNRYNAFVRKLIYQEAYDRFKAFPFSLETKYVEKSSLLVVTKTKSKDDIEKEKYLKELEDVSEAVGFSKIIRHLSKSKKLIIGHNMLLDICHIINRFFVPLPSSYKEFKELVTAIFPRLVDTKYMCLAFPFRDLFNSTVLEHMLARLHDVPFEFIDAEVDEPGYGYSSLNDKSHEAGYDAYVTGLAFISMTTYLGKQRDPPVYPVLPNSKILRIYINKLHLMKLMDNAYIDLNKEDVVPPNRHRIFHITFPKHWLTGDILQLFEKYGKPHVSYCNSTSAWITLLDDKMAKLANDHYKTIGIASGATAVIKKECTIMKWHDYQRKLNNKKKLLSKEQALRANPNYFRIVEQLIRQNANDTTAKRTENFEESATPVVKKIKSGNTDDDGDTFMMCDDETVENNPASSALELTKETREFLLQDLIQEDIGELVDRNTSDKISADVICLSALEKLETPNDSKIFEEPSKWD